MQATQRMNRTAQGPKWKPESAALRSRLLHAYVYRSFVYSRRARGCHLGVKMGVKVWDKRRKAVGEDGIEKVSISSSCTDCSCKPAEKTVLVEIDTWTRKQKANETNNPCRSSKKSVVETDSKSSKIIDPGEMRQAGLRDGRQPRCPGPSLRNGPRSLPKEKSRSSRRRILCSYLHSSTPTISEHNPKFPARKKLRDCLLSDLFPSTTMTGTDGSRPQQPRLITQSKWRTAVLNMAANDA